MCCDISSVSIQVFKQNCQVHIKRGQRSPPTNQNFNRAIFTQKIYCLTFKKFGSSATCIKIIMYCTCNGCRKCKCIIFYCSNFSVSLSESASFVLCSCSSNTQSSNLSSSLSASGYAKMSSSVTAVMSSLQ